MVISRNAELLIKHGEQKKIDGQKETEK